jgi:hypothetical protein
MEKCSECNEARKQKGSRNILYTHLLKNYERNSTTTTTYNIDTSGLK